MPSDTTETERLGQRPVIVASHPRSGTHLLIDLLRRQFAECRSWKLPGERLNRLYLNLESLFDPDSRGPISEAKALRVVRRVPRPVVKTHLLPPDLAVASATASGGLGRAWRDWLARRGRVMYVYRDGRDVMCSYHFFSKIDPAVARCSVGEFMRQTAVGGVSRPKYWAEHVRRWLQEPGVVAVRFEDVVADPQAVVRRLAEELELTPLMRQPLQPRRFRGVWASRLARLFGMRPQSTAIVSHLRRHRLERWRAAFTEADRRFFDAEAGDLLLDLGYECSRDWIAAPLTASP